jgi:hypothetical protein
VPAVDWPFIVLGDRAVFEDDLLSPPALVAVVDFLNLRPCAVGSAPLTDIGSDEGAESDATPPVFLGTTIPICGIDAVGWGD